MSTLLIYILICLNLSHAQVVSPPPATPTTPLPAPTITPLPPATTPMPALNSLINSISERLKPPPPPNLKYEEYQSICRTNDFDTIAYFNDATKAARLQILKESVTADPQSARPRLWLLKELVDQKKITEAEKELKELKTLKLKTAELDHANAIYSFGRGDQKKSRDLLNGILVAEPKNIAVLKLLAEVYKVDGNYYEAAAIYLDLAKLTRENFDEQLCETYTLDGHYTDAEEKCVTAATKSPFPNIYLGVGARERENYKEARRYFTNSLKIKETEMANVCLGEVYKIEKKTAAAIESFTNATKVVPRSFRAYIALAWAQFNEKNRPQALEQFQKACALNRRVVVEVRRALKILLDEKSPDVNKYSQLVQKCESLN